MIASSAFAQKVVIDSRLGDPGLEWRVLFERRRKKLQDRDHAKQAKLYHPGWIL